MSIRNRSILVIGRKGIIFLGVAAMLRSRKELLVSGLPGSRLKKGKKD
jgi:hypothetical protein